MAISTYWVQSKDQFESWTTSEYSNYKEAEVKYKDIISEVRAAIGKMTSANRYDYNVEIRIVRVVKDVAAEVLDYTNLKP